MAKYGICSEKNILFLKSNFFKLYYILMYTQMLSRVDKKIIILYFVCKSAFVKATPLSQ